MVFEEKKISKVICIRLLTQQVLTAMIDPVLTVDKRRSRSQWRQVHYLSGLVLATFVGVHLTNHLLAGVSPAAHIAFMTATRMVYRHPIVETALLATVILQIVTGVGLVRSAVRQNANAWRRLHVGSGLYLALFLVIHVSAVIAARLLWDLDTNFYFGAAGLNHYPHQLFFVPYYTLAILAFFAHVAAVHRLNMSRNLATVTPLRQAQFILVVGTVVAFGVLYGMTNHFRGFTIPTKYLLLTP